jgi:uncharacterized protein (DUF952 family)
MKLIYHITTDLAWSEAQEKGEVLAESLATEGFIHCSRQSQVVMVANRYFPGASGMLVLAIDEEAVRQWLVYEGLVIAGDPYRTESFPHVYAPIPVSAVVAKAPLVAEANGSFSWPPTLVKG